MSEFTMSGNEKICAFCKGYAEQKCSVCKIVYYCSREHQKSDWKTHSKNCEIVKLVDDPKFGRHYIATRDIEIDEIVLKENEPLLITPEPGTQPVCLNCYVPLTPDIAKQCENCGWPLCLECTNHGPECQLTMKYRSSKVEIKGYSVPNDLYRCVTVMKVIAMREKSPKDFKKFMNLEDHCTELMKKRPDAIEHAHFLKTWLGIYDLNEAEIARMIGIVAINGYTAATPKQYKYVTVFDKASYYTHDCRPNCMWKIYYNVNTGAKIVIRAVRMIPKGQPVTITYTNPLCGTEKRRRILEISKFFECMCERCNDPTEFGTMLSAVKCLRENCTGYMLPPTFLVPPDTQIPDWICKKCNLTASSTTIDEIINEASSQFAKLNTKNSNELRQFIVDQSKILHHNHFHIVTAHIHIIYNEKNKDLESMSNELVKEKIPPLKKLDRLLEIIAPCDYKTRGTIRYAEFQYTMTLCVRESLLNRVKILGLYENSKKLLIEAYRLLRNEEDENTSNDVKMIRSQLEDFNRWSDVFKVTKSSS